MKVSSFLQILSCVAVLGICYWSHSHTANKTVAIHFEALGKADSFSSSISNFYFSITITLFLNLLFWFLPALMKRTPSALINIPNKNYWLKTENKPLMLEKLSTIFRVNAVMLNILLLVIFYATYQANQLTEPQINNSFIFTSLGLFFCAETFWLVWLFKQFKTEK